MPLSRKALALLRAMDQAELAGNFEDAEIVVDGRSAFLGLDPVPGKIIIELLSVMSISDRSDGGSLMRYAINGPGRDICADPSLASRIQLAIAEGKPFTIAAGQIRTL